MIKVLKSNDFEKVYIDTDNPNFIHKVYSIDNDVIIDKYMLNKYKEKLLCIMNKKDLPEFILKPINVISLNDSSFEAIFPYVKGLSIRNYFGDRPKLETIAKYIKELESMLLKYENYVFPDLLSDGNLIITNKKNSILVDIDDIQFDKYNNNCYSGYLTPFLYLNLREVMGLNKCINEDGSFNKQLDIRSIYALTYILIHSYRNIYSGYDLSMCEDILSKTGVPENSSLYEKTMITFDSISNNEPIGDSLFELIDEGYVLRKTKYYSRAFIRK